MATEDVLKGRLWSLPSIPASNVAVPGDGPVIFFDTETQKITAKLCDGSQIVLEGAPIMGDVTVLNWPAEYPVTGQFWQATQPVSGTFWPATQPVSGSVDVGNWPAGFLAQVTNWPSSQAVTGTFWQATQPVSGTFWQATQPVSIAAPVAVTGTFWQSTQPVSGPLTDTQLRAAAVPVSGTFFQATQPVSGTFWQATQPVSGPLTDAQLRAVAVPVSGTFWQATQPVSLASAPLPTGAAQDRLTTLCVTVEGTGAQTATLAAAGAGNFHYITAIRVVAYATAARTGGATPTTVTTTNLPGNPAFTFPSAQAIGTTAEQTNEFARPLKSSAANTATTIVCPSTTSVRWRATVFYQAGP